jgi:hypothetical protein
MGVTKAELYKLGIEAAKEFLELNRIEVPVFRTYAEAAEASRPGRHFLYFARVTRLDQRRIGAGTGLYYDGYVFVNVPVTASPVARPMMRSWSWPGYKVDRTAIGVVAHETGHHVEHELRKRGALTKELGQIWIDGVRRTKKRVSSYEPVPDEAWAESMRLFILNPRLLQEGLLWRFNFIYGLGIFPIPRLMKKGWKKVLANKNYEAAAERWIGASS